MTSRISHTSFDARNAYAQSVFWSQVLDFAEDPDDPNEPGHEECLIISRDQTQLLLFITVPDDKQVKRVRLFKKYLIPGCFGHAARLRRSMVSSS
jgi:hypothetical protein